MRTLHALALILAWSLFAVAASADELTIDGSSQETFEASIQKMRQGLSEEDSEAFAGGLLNLILTEYPPAKGQEGLSILLFAQDAVKAAPRTLDGKTLEEILARGREMAAEEADRPTWQAPAEPQPEPEAHPAEDPEVALAEAKLDCLRHAVVVERTSVVRDDYTWSLELHIANGLNWPISGIRFHYQISTEGRAVPWAEDDVVTSIAGGIEPGEVRRVTVPRIYMPSEARGRFFTTVTINDVADQDKRLLIGDVRVIDWDETRSTRICGPAGQVPIAPAPIAAAEAAVGSPLTSAEKDGLRLALQRCWDVPAGLRDASALKVTVGAELAASGDVINASIRLIEPNPAPDGRFQQLFEATRRAIIRCSPFTDLPREKYAQWRNIEVVANPEGIVSW